MRLRIGPLFAGVLLSLTLLIPVPANAQAVAGAITVGAFLSNLMDQLKQAIDNAKNAGLTVEIGAGTQAAIAISEAQNAFSSSANSLFDKDLNPTIKGSLDQLQGLVNDVSTNAFQTERDATTRAQAIVDTLPFRNGEPQVTSITPNFVVPSQAVYHVQIRVSGNFVDVGNPSDNPTLIVNGQSFSGATATQTLQFSIPITAIYSSTDAANASSFGSAKIELDVPWEKPQLLGLFHSRQIDHFTIFIGALPAFLGTITITQVITNDVSQTQPVSAGQGEVSSQSAAGNNDQIGVPAVVNADAGWSIVPGTCNLVYSAHGDYSISGPTQDAHHCQWSLTTIHHRIGSSGIIDYSPRAMETQEVPTPAALQIPSPFTMGWGDSKVVPLSSSNWTLALDSFDGKHNEYNGPEISNPFITITNALNNSLEIQATNPSTLVWP